jgi:hypothetical protein
MAFLLIPLVIGGGALLLSGCGGGGESDRPVPADTNPAPNPSGSGSAFVPSPPPSSTVVASARPLGSSIVATGVSNPPPPVAVGAAPGGADLARFPGDTDADRARNWAIHEAIGRTYFRNMRMNYPGISARDAVSETRRLIQSNQTTGPFRVTYTAGGVEQTYTVENPEVEFLGYLIREDVPGIRSLMHRDDRADLTDAQYQDLKTAATAIVAEARSAAGGGRDANPPPAGSVPRPVGSAPRPVGGSPGNHLAPPPRRSVSF